MNINALLPYLPTLAQKFGIDLTKEVDLFFRARAAVATTQNQAGQEFVMENWRSLADFMESDEGQMATAAFIDAWKTPKKA